MTRPRTLRIALLLLGSFFWSASAAFASAYNARPKLIVVIVIDQFRGDYLERYRDQLGDGGFRLFLDRGAYFTDCNYDYANTRTAPGHATLFTGSYTSGHGILANEWWDAQKKKRVTSVEDDATKPVGLGADHPGPGASPHNLMSDTLGDELKLATGGQSRVFAISLKDRAAVLPAGFSGDGAYWIDPKSGSWITSTYYRPDLPDWVRNFNGSSSLDGRAAKFWNREWKDRDGTVLGSTVSRKAKDGSPASFYEVVGSTPFANEYQLEFARELVVYEKLGANSTTDLLVISLSANDILGHQVGPDSPQMRSMALELDRQLAVFFTFLGRQVGMANVWMALSADHGIAPLPEFAKTLRLPAANLDAKALREKINSQLSKKYAKKADYVLDLDYPLAWLNAEAFVGTSGGKDESVAEADAGEAMKQAGLTGYFTKSQLARGDIPPTEIGRRYAHSYSPEGGWYVIGIPTPFQVGITKGTDHATPFSYDTHVPLAFYGLAFQPGIYRTHAEPVDLAVTLASLLGINAPALATGRVLTEVLQQSRHSGASDAPPVSTPAPKTLQPLTPPGGEIE
ncbi:MAG TPA: alkaline phosphatase family protein [Terriglobales bacterium]|jgi:predicted AlkP superfamily pyrophosphatase or phosphodiesterase|nr:alkaline phosphatase family protein [Terriglobales bacterium]